MIERVQPDRLEEDPASADRWLYVVLVIVGLALAIAGAWALVAITVRPAG